MRLITTGKIRDWLPLGKVRKVGPFWYEAAISSAEWWESQGYSVVAKRSGKDEYYLYMVKK